MDDAYKKNHYRLIAYLMAVREESEHYRKVLREIGQLRTSREIYQAPGIARESLEGVADNGHCPLCKGEGYTMEYTGVVDPSTRIEEVVPEPCLCRETNDALKGDSQCATGE